MNSGCRLRGSCPQLGGVCPRTAFILKGMRRIKKPNMKRSARCSCLHSPADLGSQMTRTLSQRGGVWRWVKSLRLPQVALEDYFSKEKTPMCKSVAAAFLIACVLFAIPAPAQVTTADIVGRVLDPKGLAVAGARVTVQNTETGLKREALTGDTGDYAVTLLPVGTYKVTVEKAGFAKTLVEKVELVVGAKQTLDVTLKVGSITEVVTITEEPPLVETTRSDLGGSVSPAEVKQLPVLDRNFAGLMTLVPGVRPAGGFDPTKTRSGNISLNGSDGRSFDYNVDGGDNKDNVIGGIVQNFTMEGIQEFNVSIDRYTAEQGRTAAGVVNVISKSGTNTIHGSAFGLFQNSSLNKIDFFTEQQGLPKPLFHRYHFGGSAGGPIIKDKLFAFGAYEHKREPGSITVDPDAFRELSLFPLAA